MYQNKLAKEPLRMLWLRAYGYIDAIGNADAYALNQADRLFNIWYGTMEPLIHAINELSHRLDDTNNGCKMFQQKFREEIEQCLKTSPEDK